MHEAICEDARKKQQLKSSKLTGVCNQLQPFKAEVK